MIRMRNKIYNHLIVVGHPDKDSFCYNGIFKTIIRQLNRHKENYKIMQLYSPNISIQGKNKICYAIEEAEQQFNKTEVMKMMNEDGFGVFNWTDLFATMKRIVADNA